MKIIIAKINAIKSFNEKFVEKLSRLCRDYGIDSPVFVKSPENFLKVFEENREQPFLLFSNFPPNSSYRGSGKSLQKVDRGEYFDQYWEADSYSKTVSLFSWLKTGYVFKGISIITGAPEARVNDEMLASFFPGTNISVQRVSDWLKSKIPYDILYERYIFDEIRRAQKNCEK